VVKWRRRLPTLKPILKDCFLNRRPVQLKALLPLKGKAVVSIIRLFKVQVVVVVVVV
jgi:hypothetical protein